MSGRYRAAAAAAAMTGLVMMMAALLILLWSSHRAASTGLVEDVTDPLIKHRFLSKFQKARARHDGRSLHSNTFLDTNTDSSGEATKGHKRKVLTNAQKAKIAEQMKKLKAEILNDYSSNTKFGKRVDCSYP